MLKLQYSERRRLVEHDLMREALVIQEVEAKLMQLQQQRAHPMALQARTRFTPSHHSASYCSQYSTSTHYFEAAQTLSQSQYPTIAPPSA